MEKEKVLMYEVGILFPNQLFEENPLLRSGVDIYLVEEFLFFSQYAFHKTKLAFHRASMKSYAHFIGQKNIAVHYIEAGDEKSDIRTLVSYLKAKGIKKVRFIDPVDDWLEERLMQQIRHDNLHFQRYPSSLFLNTSEYLAPFFSGDKKRYFQTEFYIAQRRSNGILLESTGQPLGGKWSFDQENRKKYPRDKQPPAVDPVRRDEFWEEALTYVKKNFKANPGFLGSFYYPIDFPQSELWFEQFLRNRLADFGAYEDAILQDEMILHHSVLTPMLNAGLLTPQRILHRSLEYAVKENIPLNSIEGFIRQIIGWREFVRGMYHFFGRKERSRNYWNFTRKMPASFYEGTTGVLPYDQTVQKVLHSGYCHHIERLMILGNFMLLCEIDPDEVYRWFMELFIDAYDWVMVPNIYGMSQFADGGLFATKPYISGSNYIMKMSDYPKGKWQEIWDALFWRFMHVHRDFFLGNPRLGMLIRTFDRMDAVKQRSHLELAESYLSKL